MYHFCHLFLCLLLENDEQAQIANFAEGFKSAEK